MIMRPRSPHHALRLTLTVLTAIAATWAFGLLIYFIVVACAKPEFPEKSTDVIVVLTGGTGRIEEGFRLMAQSKAKAMLITGVHPDVTLPQLIDRWPAADNVKTALRQHCCIYIDYAAMSTEDNAVETRGWLERNGGATGVTVRIVTSDYHMPRSSLLYRHYLDSASIYRWPVTSGSPFSLLYWRQVMSEYHKTILTLITG